MKIHSEFKLNLKKENMANLSSNNRRQRVLLFITLNSTDLLGVQVKLVKSWGAAEDATATKEDGEND